MISFENGVICVTNRLLCGDVFLTRLERIAETGADILLREKDLDAAGYEQLATACMERFPQQLILRAHAQIAKKLHAARLHLSMEELRAHGHTVVDDFEVSTSVHSVEEAIEAEKLGAALLVAGHIYETECKKGLEPRGTDFLTRVCNAVSLPVYAIGGINPKRAAEVKKAGASGVCVMSALMTTPSPERLVRDLQNAIK